MEPIDALTEEDFATIRKYIELYGDCEPGDLRDVLSAWNKNKRTLFKALGNKLRISKPLSVEKKAIVYEQQLKEIYTPYNLFSDMTYELSDNCPNHPFIKKLIEYQEKTSFYEILYSSSSSLNSFANNKKACENMLSFSTMRRGTLLYTLDLPPCYDNQRGLKIVKGTKTMKGIQKFLKYIHFLDIPENAFLFEKWRNEISNVNTSNTINQKLVISIHPIDYMSMSDNNCYWHSCMSWVQDGCYSGGTIEMLNSNNVVVCYLESSRKTFSVLGHQIPNKSWRSLLVAHKDILVVGKPYPYNNDNISHAVLELFQEQVKKTLNWKYQYQYQKYLDNTAYHDNWDAREQDSFEKNQHKIILYTYGMYNDMVEDHDTSYMCCRNYVEKSKRISISGISTCLCCGKPLEEIDEIHNHSSDSDILSHSSCKICDECHDKKRCSCCETVSLKKELYYIPTFYSYDIFTEEYKQRNVRVCRECLISDYFYDTTSRTFYKTPSKGKTHPMIRRKIFEGGTPIRITEENIDKLCAKYKTCDSF